MTRDEQLRRQAAEAFSRHVIRRRSDGRWLLQRRYKDDKGWDCVYAAEVISLWGGELYVGGDIDFVIFAHYNDTRSHESKLRWMGEHTDLGYYVRQKASIGTGRQLIDVYESDAAEAQLREWLAERTEQLGEDHDEEEDGPLDVDGDELVTTINEMLQWMPDDPGEMLRRLHDVSPSFMDDRYELGMVLAPRVYFAHAALRRLCDLLDAETDNATPVTHNQGDGRVQRDSC
jgi:hypothetical protein